MTFSILKQAAKDLLKQTLEESALETGDAKEDIEIALEDHATFADNFHTYYYQILYYLTVILELKKENPAAIKIGVQMIQYQRKHAAKMNIVEIDGTQVDNSVRQDYRAIVKELTKKDESVIDHAELSIKVQETLRQCDGFNTNDAKSAAPAPQSHAAFFQPADAKTISLSSRIFNSLIDNRDDLTLSNWSSLTINCQDELIEKLKSPPGFHPVNRLKKAEAAKSPAATFIWLQTLSEKDEKSLTFKNRFIMHQTRCLNYLKLNIDRQTIEKHINKMEEMLKTAVNEPDFSETFGKSLLEQVQRKLNFVHNSCSFKKR